MWRSDEFDQCYSQIALLVDHLTIDSGGSVRSVSFSSSYYIWCHDQDRSNMQWTKLGFKPI